MRKIKAIFLPYSDYDPYTDLLTRSLSAYNITVNRPKIKLPLLFSLAFTYSPDILHLQWLHVFFIEKSFLISLLKLFIFIVQISMIKIMGIRIIWTVHNLKNHENRHLFLDRACSNFIAKISDGVIVHCSKAKEIIIKEFGIKNTKKIFIMPHGNYIGYYENRIAQTEARETLNIPHNNLVFLFLGAVRPYKDITELTKNFKRLNISETRLVIAGKPINNETKDEINRDIAECNNIIFIPEFIPDNKIQLYMNACDVVVFPYKDILTTGGVILAMSFAKPCISPKIGCIGEVLDDNGGFLYSAKDRDGLFTALNKSIYEKNNLLKMGKYNFEKAKQWDWTKNAEQIYKIYSSI